jgi:hypothetical protein
MSRCPRTQSVAAAAHVQTIRPGLPSCRRRPPLISRSLYQSRENALRNEMALCSFRAGPLHADFGQYGVTIRRELTLLAMNQRRLCWDDPQITIERRLQFRINTIRCRIHSVTGDERATLATELQNALAALVECIEQRHVFSAEHVGGSSGGSRQHCEPSRHQQIVAVSAPRLC